MGTSILKALRMLARAQSRSRVEQVAGVSTGLDLSPPYPCFGVLICPWFPLVFSSVLG